MSLKLISDTKCFGGHHKRYSHQSSSTLTEMNFAIYLPPQAEKEKVPALWYLSGLTCTDENFSTKAGAQRYAAEHGIALIAPDTSPRGANIEGETENWDFGVGAGFYLNATEPKWNKNYNMYSYITEELWNLIIENFPINKEKQSITGHSMGGHGALICSLKNPGKYKSVSAFAPISNPIEAPLGKKAFSGYLGSNQETWNQYDATHLVASYKGPELHLLIDQGSADEYLTKKQLLPENFKASADKAGITVNLRFQEGYDHGYYFVSTFIGEHIAHHAKYLHA